MTTITQHPDDTHLMSFAAGALAEPLAAAVAAHLALCRRCRKEMKALEALGGVLLEGLAPVGPADGAATGVILPVAHGQRAPSVPAPTQAVYDLPKPIADKYGLRLATVPWRWLAPGVRFHALPLSPGVRGDLRLLKIAAGRKMPVHGHGGAELTLVLDGAFSDATGRYGPGDIQDVDDDVEHQPVVDTGQPCVCLVASEQPARFKGMFSRLLQPWTGM